MPARTNCVKYLFEVANCLHVVKILEIPMKKYTFSEKVLRTYGFIFKVYISNIAKAFCLFYESGNILHLILME